MFEKIKNSDHYLADHGWLKTRLHFSFAEYYDPANAGFGVLRVLNDDIIKSNTGFDTHPHRDMEIITYIIRGKITHQDSMNNKRKLSRGEVQYMSAGTGVFHSEFNLDEEELRLFQLWIYPDKKDYEPNYGEERFNWDERVNNFLHMVSSKNGEAPVKINQDVNIYSAYLEVDKEFKLDKNRQIYLVVAEGNAEINGVEFTERDALKSDENLNIKPQGNVHILIVEMNKI
jgi:redox-sensitive bicupin YhaK (pirin superfamily)